jgi:4-alpha-glucanotransferase
LLQLLAHSPAHITLVNLEDLWLEQEPQNVPGTSHEKPNWRRRMRYTLDELRNTTELDQTLQRIDAARRAEKDGSK